MSPTSPLVASMGLASLVSVCQHRGGALLFHVRNMISTKSRCAPASDSQAKPGEVDNVGDAFASDRCEALNDLLTAFANNEVYVGSFVPFSYISSEDKSISSFQLIP